MKNKNWFKELIPYLIILVTIVLIRSFIVTPVRVSGESMKNTLMGGEIMILNKLGNVKRYSMVVADIVINGQKDDTVEDKYAHGETYDFDEVTLKEDEYFLLGDNRVVSLDSRYVGPVKKDAIEGTTSLIIWPFNKFGFKE